MACHENQHVTQLILPLLDATNQRSRQSNGKNKLKRDRGVFGNRQQLQFICFGVLKSSRLNQMYPVGFGAVPQKLHTGWVDV